MSKAATVSSHTFAVQGGLDPVEGDVQRQHARGAQDHLLELERRLDQRHPRQLALRHELAGGVDHHPGAVEVEAGLDQQRLGRGRAGAGLDRIDVNRFEAHRVCRGRRSRS
jgi:hypothetical protein